MKITPGIIIKDDTVGLEDFAQQVAIIVKVKELPKVLKDNFKQDSNGKDIPFKHSSQYSCFENT